jgi:hypothetical protein
MFSTRFEKLYVLFSQSVFVCLILKSLINFKLNIITWRDHYSVLRFLPGLFTIFLTIFARWMQLEEQELLTLPERPSSFLVFSGVRVAQSLLLFCRLFFCLLFLLLTTSGYPLVSCFFY